jgi:hypothetical protein
MAANVAVAQDPAGNLKPAKDKSTERIDGIVATIMAIGRAMVAQEEPQPEYSIVLSMSRCLAARRSFASRNPLIADRSAGSSRPDTPPPAAGSAAGPRPPAGGGWSRPRQSPGSLCNSAGHAPTAPQGPEPAQPSDRRRHVRSRHGAKKYPRLKKAGENWFWECKHSTRCRLRLPCRHMHASYRNCITSAPPRNPCRAGRCFFANLNRRMAFI